MLTPLAVGLALALVIVGIAVLAWPLVGGRRTRSEFQLPAPVDPGSSDLARLRQRRTAVLRLIREIDGERALGNLSEEEHRTQRARYVIRAASLIREIEGREQVFREEIERALEAERALQRRPQHDTSRQRPKAG